MSVELSRLAKFAWKATQKINHAFPEGLLPTPAWSDQPLLKRRERSFPPLGPRITQSVCPTCLLETRDGVLREKRHVHDLTHNPGLISAEIVEEAGRVLMRKSCNRHGPVEDVLASNADFFWRMESLFPGHDFERAKPDSHGLHSVRYGRGSFLIVDLTTRCNMKCTPCFMDANDLGHVYEPSLGEITALLDHAAAVKPRREFNILFSGGEPTISPHFLDAVRYARKIGLARLHVATNGIRFAEDPEFAKAAHTAGLHAVYLQLDGTTDESNLHRGIANLFEVKERALANIAAAGMRTTLQVTVIRGINNGSVGSIADFAAKNIDKVFGVVFQPVMFTGRDEQVSEQRRYEQRYTLSQLASDLQGQSTPDWQPLRDWFPMGVYSTFCTYVDMLYPDRLRGSTYVNAHPDSGVFSPLVVNRTTGEWRPLSSFFNVESFLSDLATVIDSARGATLSRAQVLMSIFRNFDAPNAPEGFGTRHLLPLLRQSEMRMSSQVQDWSEKLYDDDDWSLLLVAGMWFQDLFNYELENIQMSTAIVADPGVDESMTVADEVSFSFKNAGGWRQVVERFRHATSLSTWHRGHGRHAIYTNGVSVTVDELSSSLQKLTSLKETLAAMDEALL